MITIDTSIIVSSFYKLIILLIMPCIISCNRALVTINSEDVYNTKNLHFSNAVIHQNIIYGSGQVGWDNDYSLTGKGTFSDQFQQSIKNIEAILNASGSDLQDIIHYRFYIPDLANNHKTYISQFLSLHYTGHYQPATSIIGIDALAKPELLIEIEFIAQVNNAK